ncbi:MAG: hypothetical protein J6X44_13260, partial [Thermoguttaceae bacterium]|nr:hypothetical protein [Thermoguttaceae bacterium]
MISLIPCYSLEDFSIYRQASEVDEIFSAWSALYHPALVAHFGEAPRWEAAGSPSTSKKRRLVVVPPCAEYLVSRSWLKSAEEEGAVVIRHIADRDEILKIAFEKLNLTPNGSEQTSPSLKELENDARKEAQNANTDQKLPYDDAAESFLAVGLGCLLEELLTRKLRYMSNLDQVSFNMRIVDAAQAYVSNNVEEREKNLQKAFDLLTTSKEYFFPTATKFLDLTWVKEEDFAKALPDELAIRKLRNEKTNIVLPVPLIKKCETDYPKTFAALREEIQAKRVSLIGSDQWEAPLYLMEPTEIISQLIAGRNEYLRAFGVAPAVFGRQEAGYAQILPQLLKQTGYRGVLSRTGDGWSILEKPSDRSQFRWQGRDGSTIAALCKRPLDATSSEDLLQLPDRIGNSYYSDNASAIVFEHRPGEESRWLRDILRMDRYSPVLGKFYDVNEYFRVTEGSGDKEKFVKDRFKTNFLSRSVKRDRTDVVSTWVRRQRLCQIKASFGALETTIRTLTHKTKPSPELERAFNEYLSRSDSLIEKTEKILEDVDAYLLPAEHSQSVQTPILDELFEQLEQDKQEMLTSASRYLALARGKNDEPTGSLFVNVASTDQNAFWEAYSSKGKDAIIERLQQYFEQITAVKVRSFSSPTSDVVQYVATIPAGTTFWLPAYDDVEYRFHSRPLFDAQFPSDSFLSSEKEDERLFNSASDETDSSERESSNRKKGGLFQKIASKIRGDVPNSANAQDNETDDVDSRVLAEYVEKRYSQTEVEKYYRLHNDFFEIRIDPVMGSVRRLTTYRSNARLSNGVLRQPGVGNRLAWDFALKLPEDLLKEDRRPEDDSYYGYTTSAADSFEILADGPGVGRILIVGRMVAPNGELAGKYTQTLTVRLKSKIIEVEVELEPIVPPGATPWESYYGCRLAWKDAMAEIKGGVAASLIGTTRDYIQAPESVDVRSDEHLGITILSSGLPYFKKISDTRLDAILIPKGETKRRFRFAIGIDLDDPHYEALEYLAPAPLRLDNTPCPKRPVSTFLSSS